MENTPPPPPPPSIKSLADFNAAFKAAGRQKPETWERVVILLIKAGHGAALLDIIPNLSKVPKHPISRPNFTKDTERMFDSMLKNNFGQK